MSAIKLKDAGGKKSTKSVANLLSNVQSSKPFAQFLFCVPCRQVVYCAGEENGFNDTKECSYDQKLVVSLDRRGGGRDTTPDDHS